MESVEEQSDSDCLEIFFCLSHVSWAKQRFCEGMFETDEIYYLFIWGLMAAIQRDIYFIFMDIYNNERLWH
jgi:hypothetical protein